MAEQIKQLLDIAESKGWKEAFYQYNKAQLRTGKVIVEDQRMADWINLLPLNGESVVLVLGCGFGTIPVTLAERCRGVYVADSSWERIAFLNTWKEQQGIDNLFPAYVSGKAELPFHARSFDLVVMLDFQWRKRQSVRVGDAVRGVQSLLKEGGIVYMGFGNRLSFQRLLGLVKSKTSLPLHTIYGYRRILEEEGFSDIQFYAPLPYHDGIPLFYVPLKDNQTLNFFFCNIFPLFETVSPEVKRAYAFEHMVAKIGVRLALLFRLSGLFKIFVPGFSIIAKKGRG